MDLEKTKLLQCLPPRFHRLMCGLIDIILAIFVLPAFIGGFFENIFVNDIFLIYFVLIPILTMGQTIGQWIFGFKLISISKKRLTPFRLVARQVFCIYLSPIFFLGLIFGKFPLTTDLDQLPQDRLMQTVVVKKTHISEFSESFKGVKKSKYTKVGIILAFCIIFTTVSFHF